jgi:hypothetical protein
LKVDQTFQELSRKSKILFLVPILVKVINQEIITPLKDEEIMEENESTLYTIPLSTTKVPTPYSIEKKPI